MSSHSRFSASSASRWMNCPASIAHNVGDDTSSLAADTGTVVHWLASEYYSMPEWLDIHEGGWLAVREGDVVRSEPGAEGAILVSAEMLAHIEGYWDYLNDHSEDHGCTLYLEERLDLTEVVGADCGGTADAINISLRDGYIQVFDLKYGMRRVDAADNKQLMMYALEAYHKFKDRHWKAPLSKLRFEIHIYQPRIGITDYVHVSLPEVLNFERDVKTAIAKAQTPEPSYQPSEKACQWCAAKATCPALRDEVTKQLSIIEPPACVELTPEQQVAFYAKIPLLETWIKAISEAVYSRAIAGEPIPGYKLVQGRPGNRQWDAGRSEASLILELIPYEIDPWKISLSSPAEMVTKLKQSGLKPQQAEDIVNPLTNRSEGKPTLVEISDKRPAIKSIEALFDED